MTDITRETLAPFFPPRSPDSHKGTYGHVLIIAGSETYLGAPVLAAMGALRSGCGLCTLATVPEIIPSALCRIPEAMFRALEYNPALLAEPLERADSVVCGMGLSTGERSEKILTYLIKNNRAPLILDADALNLVAQRPALRVGLRQRQANPAGGYPLALTPHLGELARLAGEGPASPARALELARGIAGELGAVVVLKGHRTLVVDPAGEVFRNTTGNPGLARGGSGDVLSGMIGSLCARFAASGDGRALLNAAVAGVFLHGLAADIAAEIHTQEAMLPSDVVGCLGKAFARVIP
jgi:hydroxyethylthiazole kinase-like uncharacterized protein yjeF